MEDGDQVTHSRCFHDWMGLQERDLSELLQFLTLSNGNVDDHNAEQLGQLIDKNIKHFEEYINQRASNAPRHISPYFCPPWCTSLEASMMWAGGCRPSIFIRLIYALTGSDILSRLQNNHDTNNGVFSDLSGNQLVLINVLQMQTIREEDRISGELASLQEEVADQPIAIIARKLPGHGEANAEADEALKALDESMTSMLQQADNLRLDTLKEVMNVLTPVQALHFLVAARKLHLCLHGWGRKRDDQHGRN